MTNWKDGGGYYPPGSDTPSAPWNQPDLSATDEQVEKARGEVWVLLEWNHRELGPNEISIGDLIEMIEMVVPYKDWKRFGYDRLTEDMEVAAETEGFRAAVALIGKPGKVFIEKCASAWVDDRAVEIAREESDDFRY